MRLGSDEALLVIPAAAIDALEREQRATGVQPATVARLPRFLRTFFLRFLVETQNHRIERFDDEEGGRISDLLVDLEERGERRTTWALLSNFVDLCDYFAAFGLMSVPDAAIEHDSEVFELTARVLHDLSAWAEANDHHRLQGDAFDLATRLDAIHHGVSTE